MPLSIGIVGLPNVGKSTLFNALTRQQNAEAANYPFCTIEPNKATVPVPDKRLDKLATLVKPEKTIYATVDFIDIAGLVKGASRGEGLGNKFLANIREASAIIQVVRCFEDENVVHVEGTIDPLRDIEIIETELVLADIQSLEKRVERLEKLSRGDKAILKELEACRGLLAHVSEGEAVLTYEDVDNLALEPTLRELSLITDKKVIYCANVDENSIDGNEHVEKLKKHAESKGADVVVICARMEEEMAGLSDEEVHEFLSSYGIEDSGLDRTIRKSYHTLGLCSYFTAGPKEVRAWTIPQGASAPQAAGVIHTDFERGFIRCQVIALKDYMELGTEAACKTAGLMRTEGKEYVMQDADIVNFLFNV